jgi:hypothetical protein
MHGVRPSYGKLTCRMRTGEHGVSNWIKNWHLMRQGVTGKRKKEKGRSPILLGIGDLVSIKSINEFTKDCILCNWLSVTGACDGTMDGGRRSRTGRQRRVRRREAVKVDRFSSDVAVHRRCTAAAVHRQRHARSACALGDVCAGSKVRSARAQGRAGGTRLQHVKAAGTQEACSV